MKNKIFSIAAAVFVAGTMFTSCATQEDKEKKAELGVQDAKSDVTEAKQELTEAQQVAANDFQKFKNESTEEINSNDRHIAELRIEIKNEKGDQRTKDEQKINDLEKKNHELKEKLEAYQNDGKSDWQEFKTEFKHDLAGIGQAFKDITVRNTK